MDRKASLIPIGQAMGMSSKRPRLIQRSENTRGSSRQPVTIPATCQVGARAAEDVLVTDLSADGCRVRLVSIGVTKSEPVRLEIGTEPPVTGRLSWIKQGSLGVAFDPPLDEATVTRLSALSAPSNVIPLRRSARD